MTPLLHILLIGGKNAGTAAATQLLQVNKNLVVTIIDTEMPLYSTRPRLNLINETPVFYQPWTNTLITFEGNVYHYDYLILTPQSNNIHFIQQSILTDKRGMLNIDSKTSIHKRYNNILACCGTTEYDPGGNDYRHIISKFGRHPHRPDLKESYSLQVITIKVAA